MSVQNYLVDEAYEREINEQYKHLHALDKAPRELVANGCYLPAKGIYSVGWKGWKDLPAAEFVQELLEWHDGFVQDHSSEPFYPQFGPVLYRGELTPEELKTYVEHSLGVLNLTFYYEGIAHYRAHLAGMYEIRDMLAWHLFEETGHNEMYADFLEGFYGMDRLKEVRPLMEPLEIAKKADGRAARLERYKELNAKGEFVDIAAAAMLRERIIPKPSRMKSIGLRKHYGVPDRYMMFFDVHSYIDIYHERFGQYILAKYATTKELQARSGKAFRDSTIGEYEANKRLYNLMPSSRR